jgi:hypothetical protein
VVNLSSKFKASLQGIKRLTFNPKIYTLIILLFSVVIKALSSPQNVLFCRQPPPTFTLFNLIFYKNVRNCAKMLADVSYNTKNLASTYPDES